MSPSISAWGVSAATESITIMSTAPDLTRDSAISSACSPVSGCDTHRLSVFTPRFAAYTGSRACSASINAATPPFFCDSAMACRARVVFADVSGPYIYITLPLGYPPIPSAASSVIDPEGMT